MRDANAALLTATRSGVPGAYAKLLADDLQWVAPDGRALSKAERVASEGRSGTGRAARKVIQYAGREVIHREGRSFYDDR